MPSLIAKKNLSVKKNGKKTISFHLALYCLETIIGLCKILYENQQKTMAMFLCMALCNTF